MASASYGSVPFPEQIAFFRQKLNVPTASWTDIYGAEHDWAFMVAGANRDALLSDFRQAVEKAIAEGGTLEAFRKDFDDIVARHGWDYNGGRNWRSRVIYETNLFSSYNAGRFEQLWNDRDTLPYWQYHHNDAVTHPRPHHVAWNGITLPATDNWWKTHFTPNGWGCQCYITGLSEFDVEQMGITIDTAPPENWQEVEVGKRSPGGPRTVRVPEGIDPGFEHTPGRARLDGATPPKQPPPGPDGAPAPGTPDKPAPSTPDKPAPGTPDKPAPGTPDKPAPGTPDKPAPGTPDKPAPDTPDRPEPGPMPPPRVIETKDLPQVSGAEQAISGFLARFGADLDSPAVFQDVLGERLAIGRKLFANADGTVSADIPIVYLPLLAKTLAEPDEIWLQMAWYQGAQKATLTRRYLARFQQPGESLSLLLLLDWGLAGWRANVSYQDAELLRQGLRLYQRPEEE